MKDTIQFARISREDLLVKMNVLKAENILLKKQLSPFKIELGKKESYITELENKLSEKDRKKGYVTHLENTNVNLAKKIESLLLATRQYQSLFHTHKKVAKSVFISEKLSAIEAILLKNYQENL